MNSTSLTQIPATYIDSFNFENSGSTFYLRVSNGEQDFDIYLKKVISLTFSRDIADFFDDDITLMEISHEHRQPTLSDLKSYSFIVEKADDLPKLHMITFHASRIISVICQEVEIKQL